MKAQVDAAIKSDKLKPTEGMRLLDEYERGLKEYTYLDIHPAAPAGNGNGQSR
jgi:arginine decarboxylase